MTNTPSAPAFYLLLVFLILASPLTGEAQPRFKEPTPPCKGKKACFSAAEKLIAAAEYPDAYAHYRKACKKRHGLACLRAAEMHVKGQGVWPLPGEIRKLYRRGCKLFRKGCTDQMKRFIANPAPDLPGMERHQREFVRHHLECDKGQRKSCYQVARKYANASGGPLSFTGRLEFMRRSCKLGDKADCKTVKKLEAKAACASPKKCLSAAATHWRKRREALACLIWRRSCARGNAEACLGPARALRAGVEKKVLYKNSRLAQHYLGKACNGGAGEACMDLAEVLMASPPVGEGARHKRRLRLHTRKIAVLLLGACEGGSPRACANLLKQARQAGRGSLELPRQRRYTATVCKDPWSDDCFEAAKMLFAAARAIQPKKPALAQQAFSGACKVGHGPSCVKMPDACITGAECFELATKLLKGKFRRFTGPDAPVKYRQPAEAAEFFRRACARKDYGGCAKYGLSLSKGLGVPKDRNKARPFFQMACDFKVGEGCAKMRTYFPKGSTKRLYYGEQACKQKTTSLLDKVTCLEIAVEKFDDALKKRRKQTREEQAKKRKQRRNRYGRGEGVPGSVIKFNPRLLKERNELARRIKAMRHEAYKVRPVYARRATFNPYYKTSDPRYLNKCTGYGGPCTKHDVLYTRNVIRGDPIKYNKIKMKLDRLVKRYMKVVRLLHGVHAPGY